MSLPIRTLEVIEHWDCHGCGKCCRGHAVVLEPEDLDRLRQQNWESHPDLHGVAITSRDGWLGPRILNQRPDGRCIFLLDSGLCRIHAELGEAAKPWACRMFPFQVIPFEDHARLTMRRNCPSAAGDLGRPLKDHLDYVRKMAEALFPAGKTVAPPRIVHGRKNSWREAKTVLSAIDRLVREERFPLVRRLVHGLRFCDRLAECRWQGMDQKQFTELVDVLASTAPEKVGDLFKDRSAPSTAGALLFRQSAAEYARCHPNIGDRPPLWLRWSLFWSAVRIARGRGVMPKIHPDLPETTFADLERPLGNLSVEVTTPILNYFMAMAASAQYCGAGRFGWSIVDGFRAMALAYPVALWLLRWLATGRETTAQDANEVVQILDRSHFYPLLCGYRHRTRLNVLAQTGQLERLVVWYAR